MVSICIAKIQDLLNQSLRRWIVVICKYTMPGKFFVRHKSAWDAFVRLARLFVRWNNQHKRLVS